MSRPLVVVGVGSSSLDLFSKEIPPNRDKTEQIDVPPRDVLGDVKTCRRVSGGGLEGGTDRGRDGGLFRKVYKERLPRI